MWDSLASTLMTPGKGTSLDRAGGFLQEPVWSPCLSFAPGTILRDGMLMGLAPGPGDDFGNKHKPPQPRVSLCCGSD
ncbi:hypothetical protein DPEC_G00153320 [Dallia pectoralis]|uniref:Uncharacterized protein n=1 Tax=Dallia pectoralis TaxID=75939 RepID=A0ACC2GK34_DALPE|nr:hypothetical protein DPEC_G00153320 [Dallia pectoralis]